MSGAEDVVGAVVVVNAVESEDVDPASVVEDTTKSPVVEAVIAVAVVAVASAVDEALLSASISTMPLSWFCR